MSSGLTEVLRKDAEGGTCGVMRGPECAGRNTQSEQTVGLFFKFFCVFPDSGINTYVCNVYY